MRWIRPKRNSNAKAGGQARLSPSTVISLFALGVSLWSMWLSFKTGRDVAAVDAIKTEYQLFSDLSKATIEHPDMAHMFAVPPSAYAAVREKVRTANISTDATARAKLLLSERGTAEFIFNAFEQTFYSWKHAREIGDRERERFFSGDLDYFAVFLCNPRLVWYWSESGGRLGSAYAADLLDLYDENIQPNCVVESDSEGPFGTATR